jgi:hypothetical protein
MSVVEHVRDDPCKLECFDAIELHLMRPAAAELQDAYEAVRDLLQARSNGLSTAEAATKLRAERKAFGPFRVSPYSELSPVLIGGAFLCPAKGGAACSKESPLGPVFCPWNRSRLDLVAEKAPPASQSFS